MPLVLLRNDPRARLKPCLRCGYSLRNITEARNCPECGLAIRLTLNGDDALDLSKPEWVRGHAVAAVASAVPMLAVLALMAVVHLRHWGDDPFPAWLFFDGGPVVAFAAAGFLLLRGAGLLLLARPEGRVPERARATRLTVLWLGVTGVLGAVLLVAYGSTGRGGLPTTLLVLLALVSEAATWVYVQALARRLPNRRAVRVGRGLAVAAVAAAAFLLFRGGANAMIVALMMPWWRHSIGWTLFLLIYPATAVALLLYLTHAFLAAARAAERNWVSDPEYR